MDRSFAHNTALSRGREVLSRKSDDEVIRMCPPLPKSTPDE